MARESKSFGDKLLLFTAQGFGLGRIPFAPGTFGTLGGFAWIFLLLLPGSLWLYLTAAVAGLFGAVWVGQKAETILKQKDPGSIVLDEIVALPIAFLGPVFLMSKSGITPTFAHYLSREHIFTLLITFGLFRLFDITKPLGIHRIQSLPGGWGLVLDDILAAAWAGAGVLLYLLLIR